MPSPFVAGLGIGVMNAVTSALTSARAEDTDSLRAIRESVAKGMEGVGNLTAEEEKTASAIIKMLEGKVKGSNLLNANETELNKRENMWVAEFLKGTTPGSKERENALLSGYASVLAATENYKGVDLTDPLHVNYILTNPHVVKPTLDTSTPFAQIDDPRTPAIEPTIGMGDPTEYVAPPEKKKGFFGTMKSVLNPKDQNELIQQIAKDENISIEQAKKFYIQGQSGEYTTGNTLAQTFARITGLPIYEATAELDTLMPYFTETESSKRAEILGTFSPGVLNEHLYIEPYFVTKPGEKYYVNNDTGEASDRQFDGAVEMTAPKEGFVEERFLDRYRNREGNRTGGYSMMSLDFVNLYGGKDFIDNATIENTVKNIMRTSRFEINPGKFSLNDAQNTPDIDQRNRNELSSIVDLLLQKYVKKNNIAVKDLSKAGIRQYLKETNVYGADRFNDAQIEFMLQELQLKHPDALPDLD